jgi:hypothetical protein
MSITPSSDFASPADHRRDVTVDDASGNAVQKGMDIMKDNPVLTLVAVGVLGFAIGTLAGRSSVKRRSTLDANLDSLQHAIEAARSGASDTASSWAKALRNSDYLSDRIPARVRQQARRLLASVSH